MHHIKHWAKGAEINISNLVTLCRYHHCVLHSGEYHLKTNVNGELLFSNDQNQTIAQSFFPQLEHGNFDENPEINEQTGRALWAGVKMGLQMVLGGMFDRLRTIPEKVNISRKAGN